jgi:tRNA(Arg) A34 adenosine deaminase TadA
MQSSHVSLDSTRVAVEPHVCSICLGPTILIYIKRLLVGFEMRTFMGVHCDHVDQVLAETNAMKWASRGPRAPV